MKNLPLSSLPVGLDRTLLPQSMQSKQLGVPESSKSVAVEDLDASVVTLPKARAKSSAVDNADSVLGSFLDGIRNQSDVVSAHGGLEASRVFDLLSGDDD